MKFTITNGNFHNESTIFGDGNLPCTEVFFADDAEEIIIPDGVTAVYEMVFKNCTSLKRVVIPEGVNLIAEDAFEGCTNLRELVMPDSIEVICYNAFKDCSSLERLHLPDKLRHIHNNIFQGCGSLRALDIAPDHPHFAFENGLLIKKQDQSVIFALPSLRRADIPEGVKKIASRAFCGCMQLECVALPRSMEKIDPAFGDCENLREFAAAPDHPYFTFTDGLLIKKAKPEQQLSEEEAKVLQKLNLNFKRDDTPEVILALPFLRSVCIPEGVKTIGQCAFQNCRRLEHIDLPKGLLRISSGAFGNCSSLSKITLPDSLGDLWADAFEDCTALKEITVPSGIKSLHGTFRGCTSLRRVTLNEGIGTLSMGVFSGCTALEEIYLPASIQSIDANSFNGCTALKRIMLSEDHPCFYFKDNLLLSRADCAPHHPGGPIPVVTMHYHAQQESCVILALPSVVHAVIPQGIERIGYEAFAPCTQLESVSLPDSLTEIRSMAFRGCKALARIDLPDSLRTLRSGAFAGCTALDHVYLPNSADKIETSLFSGCTALTDVRLPESMVELPPATFARCTSLERVTLPEGVRSIKEFTFDDCTNLKEVIVHADVQVHPLAFTGCPQDADAYIHRL